MLNEKQLQELKPKLEKFNREREEARYTYLGMLSEYQLFIKEPKQTLIYTKLNTIYSTDHCKQIHYRKAHTVLCRPSNNAYSQDMARSGE